MMKINIGRDYSQWEQEEYEYPICDNCGEYSDDKVYEIYDEFICRDCVEALYAISVEAFFERME